MGHSASSAPPGAVVVYANELEYFGDVSTGNIKRCVLCCLRVRSTENAVNELEYFGDVSTGNIKR